LYTNCLETYTLQTDRKEAEKRKEIFDVYPGVATQAKKYVGNLWGIFLVLPAYLLQYVDTSPTV